MGFELKTSEREREKRAALRWVPCFKWYLCTFHSISLQIEGRCKSERSNNNWIRKSGEWQPFRTSCFRSCLVFVFFFSFFICVVVFIGNTFLHIKCRVLFDVIVSKWDRLILWRNKNSNISQSTWKRCFKNEPEFDLDVEYKHKCCSMNSVTNTRSDWLCRTSQYKKRLVTHNKWDPFIRFVNISMEMIAAGADSDQQLASDTR